MMNKTITENRAFKGSNVYLTSAEKEALKRAISQYLDDIETSDESSSFVQFFREYDEKPLSSAYDKLIGKYKVVR